MIVYDGRIIKVRHKYVMNEVYKIGILCDGIDNNFKVYILMQYAPMYDNDYVFEGYNSYGYFNEIFEEWKIENHNFIIFDSGGKQDEKKSDRKILKLMRDYKIQKILE